MEANKEDREDNRDKKEVGVGKSGEQVKS